MKIEIGVIGFCGHSYLALQEWDLLAENGIHISLRGLSATGGSSIPAAWLEQQKKDAATIYDDWRDLIHSPDIHLVVVDGPYHQHAQMLLAALQAGKHVFCEKSIALQWSEYFAIEKAISQSQARVWSMLNMRYQSGFYNVLRALEQGAIGAVRSVSVRKSYKHGQRPDWYNDRALYGGTVLWVGSHALDLLVASAGPIQSIQGMHDCAGRQYAMSAQLQCRHTNGILSSANIDFYQPASANAHSDDRLHITGTDGVIEYSNGVIRLVNQAGVQNTALVSVPSGVFADGVSAIVSGNEPTVSTDEMLMITRAALAGRDSADQNGVRMDLNRSIGVNGD